MSEQVSAKKPKGRSPAYPAISLETAIQRARQLYEKERRYPTAVTTVATHWGYRSLNGPAAQTVAALKRYGLVEDEGSADDRKVKLSELADVILVHPDTAARKAAIQDAALRPAIHREMWDKYHNDLPSDTNLLWELTHDRGFTETGAAEFVREYRSTISFAQLQDAPDDRPLLGAEDSGHAFDEVPDEEHEPESHTHSLGRPSSVNRSYAVPLIDSGSVVVEGQFPITERDWNQFIAVLTAMKPGLVKADKDVAKQE